MRKVFARLDLLDAIAQRTSAPAWLVGVYVETFADVSVECFCRDVNRTINRAEQYAQSAGVIAVFVRDEHSIEPLRVLAHHREPAHDLLGAQTGVNQHARISGDDQDCVTS